MNASSLASGLLQVWTRLYDLLCDLSLLVPVGYKMFSFNIHTQEGHVSFFSSRHCQGYEKSKRHNLDLGGKDLTMHILFDINSSHRNLELSSQQKPSCLSSVGREEVSGLGACGSG